MIFQKGRVLAQDGFAGQAISGLMNRVKFGGDSSQLLDISFAGEDEDGKTLARAACKEVAELAYMLADSLLDARQE